MQLFTLPDSGEGGAGVYRYAPGHGGAVSDTWGWVSVAQVSVHIHFQEGSSGSWLGRKTVCLALLSHRGRPQLGAGWLRRW